VTSSGDRPRRLRVSKQLRTLIRQLHPELKRKVHAALDEILRDPAAGKTLVAELSGLRSLRVGRMRIIYREAGPHVELIALGPRRQIYADTLRLLKRERAERAARADLKKARRVLSRAGKGKPPVKGDELPKRRKK